MPTTPQKLLAAASLPTAPPRSDPGLFTGGEEKRVCLCREDGAPFSYSHSAGSETAPQANAAAASPRELPPPPPRRVSSSPPPHARRCLHPPAAPPHPAPASAALPAPAPYRPPVGPAGPRDPGRRSGGDRHRRRARRPPAAGGAGQGGGSRSGLRGKARTEHRLVGGQCLLCTYPASETDGAGPAEGHERERAGAPLL